MALGRATQKHFNQVLTNVAVDFIPPELVAQRVFPVTPVNHRSDVYPVFDKSMFNNVDDIRVDGDQSREVTRGWKYVSYVTEKHALHEPITDDERDEWDSEVELESSTVEYLKQLVWNRYEVRIFGSGGILRTAGNNVYSNNEDFSNLSTASPRLAFDNAIEAVEAACGLSPNMAVMAPLVARWIMRTDEYRQEAKYTNDLRKEGGGQYNLPPEFYGLEAVYVKSLINTAKKGQATSLARIMGTDIWIGYVDPAGPGRKKVTYAATLQRYEESRSWYENARTATILEYEANYVPQIIATECGALLTTVTA